MEKRRKKQGEEDNDEKKVDMMNIVGEINAEISSGDKGDNT